MVSKKQQLYDLKKSLANIFNSKCHICSKSFGKGFTLHHLSYKDGEKIYSDFKDPLDYYTYLSPIVCKEPHRFLLLCYKCHYTVEQLKRYKTEKLNKILQVVKMSL